MTDSEQRTRRQLHRVEDRIAWLTNEQRRQIALRDHLILELCDRDGAASSRKTYPIQIEG
jgi:hypothetical protein